MSAAVQEISENSLSAGVEEASSQTISLKVLTNTGAEEYISIPNNSTLQSLQQELYGKFSVPRSHQRLFHLGHELCELDKTLQSLGILNDHVLHLNMSTREAPAVEANSCLRQLFIPSHSGVETSLGMYAESSWNDEEREKASQEIQAKHETATGDAVPGSEEKGFWQQLFIPSYSGVETSLGRYAESTWTDEKREKSIEEIKARAEEIIAAAKDALPPLWYRLFVPSDSGVAATLGSYADPVMLQNGITTDSIGASNSEVAAVDDLKQKDRYQITRLDSVSTQATEGISRGLSLPSVQAA